MHRFAAHLCHRLVQHADIGVEADRCDRPRLFGTQQFTAATDFEILRCDRKASAEFGKAHQRVEPAAGFIADLVGRHQQITVGPGARPTDAATQLIQLCQSKTIGAGDEHGIGARNIEATFDDGGGHQHIETAVDKGQHGVFEGFG